MKPEDISIKDQIYKLAVPERARTIDRLEYGQAFKQFVELFGAQFDVLKAKAEAFPRIVDVDDCPPELLPFLGSLIGFDFDYTLDVELQRDRMKTLVKGYREKGTPPSLLDIAYNYDPAAVIFEPYTWMARFNISKHSGHMRYPNRTYWNTGVFEIRIAAGDAARMRAEIVKLRPAGTRIWFHYTHPFVFDRGTLWGGYQARTDGFDFTLSVALRLVKAHALSGTLRGVRGKLSGSSRLLLTHTAVQELAANAWRGYSDSPLYSWDDVLARDPQAVQASDPVYELGRYAAITRSQELDAAYPDGYWRVAVAGSVLLQQLQADAGHVADVQEVTRVYGLGLPNARRQITGSPLYTFDLLQTEATQHLDRSGTIVSDDFTRPDSSTTLGIAPTGQTWQIKGTQTWGIQNNRAYPIAYSWDDPVYVDAGISDNISYELTQSVYHSHNQMMWRIDEGTRNYFVIQGSTLFRSVNGTWTNLGSVGAMTNGTVLRVEVSGNRHAIYKDDVLVFSFTDTNHLNGVGFGFSTNSATARFDDFKVEHLVPVLREPTVGSFIEYQDDVAITITN